MNINCPHPATMIILKAYQRYRLELFLKYKPDNQMDQYEHHINQGIGQSQPRNK